MDSPQVLAQHAARMIEARGAREIVTWVGIERQWQPDARHAERMYRAAEVGAWLREAGLVLCALLDAQALELAGVEPARDVRRRNASG